MPSSKRSVCAALASVVAGLWALPAAADPPSLEALRNLAYQGVGQSFGDASVQLADGVFEGEPFVPGSAMRPFVEMLDDMTATGDLDGDGTDDAAVILMANSGGTGVFIYVAAVLQRPGGLENVATTMLGDRVNVERVSIDGGVIALDALGHGPDDAMCCPTQVLSASFRLVDGFLVEVAAMPTE